MNEDLPAGPTSPQEQHGGALHAPHGASGGEKFVQRTVRVPIDWGLLPKETWRLVRRYAHCCQVFGNHSLSAFYVKKMTGVDIPVYVNASGELSAAIRDAMRRECEGIWSRLGRQILSGRQTLARFSDDRALVVRGRGVSLEVDGEQWYVRLRLHPGRDDSTATRLPIWMPALRKDRYLAETLNRIAPRRATKATVQFKRPGLKISVQLAYRKPADGTKSQGAEATFGPVDSEGQCWLMANGHKCGFADHIHRLRHMKAHFAGIHKRLRRCLGKRGRRQDYRRALLRASGFEEWAEGPLHQWSREIIAWCQREDASRLMWQIGEDDSLPWDRLRLLVTYKAEECGISVSQIKSPRAQAEDLRTDAAKRDGQSVEKLRKRPRSQRKKQRGEE